MRHPTRFWAGVLFTLTGAGCVAAGGDGAGGGAPLAQPERADPAPTLPSPVPPEPWWSRLDPPPPPPDLLAWTPSRTIALVDGATGAVQQELDPGAFTGERDLAYDRWGARALVFTGGADGPSGEVFAYPVTQGAGGPVLGTRAHLAWVHGTARLLPAPSGVVLFGDGGGGRWRLVERAGPVTAAVPGPHPMSAWITHEGTGAAIQWDPLESTCRHASLSIL